MIGVLVILGAMASAAFWVGGMVLGIRDKPPFGWGFGTWTAVSVGLALVGVILMGLGI
jgi:hypothetical protein